MKRPSLFQYGAVAMGLVCAVTIYVYHSGAVARSADQFMDDVFHQKWEDAYAFMGPAEKVQLGMNSEEFSKFCSAFASEGWPSRDHYQIEEMIPYIPANAQVDTSWRQSGTRKFSITFRRPDGLVDFESKIEFRHDPSGEWHPDTLPFIFSIGKVMPHGHPVQALIAGLVACKRESLEMYPFHQKTSLEELRRVATTHKGVYLASEHRHLN